MKDRLLVLGSTGMLGCNLTPMLRSCHFHVVAHGWSSSADVQYDLTDSSAVATLFEQVKPNIVINLAALTDVDVCESERDRAFRINTKIVQNVGEAILSQPDPSYLVHISTDHVYDGPPCTPSAEEAVRITNAYAMSKYAGELAAKLVGSVILRTNFICRSRVPHRKSLSDWVIGEIQLGKPINGFTDVFFSPVSINTLLQVLQFVVQTKPQGIFNVGSQTGMSKAEFISALIEEVGLPTSLIQPKKMSEVTGSGVYRPKNMTMDSSKLELKMGIKLPSFADEIKLIARDYEI